MRECVLVKEWKRDVSEPISVGNYVTMGTFPEYPRLHWPQKLLVSSVVADVRYLGGGTRNVSGWENSASSVFGGGRATCI